jgi:hypothetical protein
MKGKIIHYSKINAMLTEEHENYWEFVFFTHNIFDQSRQLH